MTGRALGVLLRALRDFRRDRCLERAGSLAYITLLCLVPLGAITLSLLSAFKLSEESVRRFLFQNFLPSSSLIPLVEENLERLARNAGTMGIMGTLSLIPMALILLNEVESSLNAIWRVQERRAFLAKFTAFWSVITLCPLLLGASLGLTVKFQVIPLIPFLFTWGLLSLVYWVMPYAPVSPRAALIGGAVGGALFELSKQSFSAYVRIRYLGTFERIYGALGAIPLFMTWVFVAWSVVLLGAELTRAIDEGGGEGTAGLAYWGLLLLAALRRRLRQGLPPPSAPQLAREAGVSPGAAQEALRALVRSGLLWRTREGHLLPRRPLEEITVGEVLRPFWGGALGAPPEADDKPARLLRQVEASALGAAAVPLRELCE